MQFDFLISSERSGSNLITKLIDGHPKYCGPSPPHLIRAFSTVMAGYGDLNVDRNWELFVEDVVSFYSSKIGIWKSEITPVDLAEVEPRGLSEVVKHIYAKEAKLNQKELVFVKEVKTYLFFNFIKDEFPSAKFVWLVRDPRDMALSWSESPVHRGDIVRASKVWAEDQRGTLELYRTHKESFLLVKYEDLIANQEQVLQEICQFLGVAFSSQMINYHQNSMSNQNALQTDNWKNLNKGIIKGNAKKYLYKLSKKQIQFIEYTCFNEMEALSYEFEYSRLDKKEFSIVEKKMMLKERHEKPEYQLISESEKRKRNIWFEKFNQIQNKTKSL